MWAERWICSYHTAEGVFPKDRATISSTYPIWVLTNIQYILIFIGTAGWGLKLPIIVPILHDGINKSANEGNQLYKCLNI